MRGCLPSEIALIKIVKARMKMIRDALPNMLISLLTACCPTKAATVATETKYTAAKHIRKEFVTVIIIDL